MNPSNFGLNRKKRKGQEFIKFDVWFPFKFWRFYYLLLRTNKVLIKLLKYGFYIWGLYYTFDNKNKNNLFNIFEVSDINTRYLTSHEDLYKTITPYKPDNPLDIRYV